MYAAYGALTSCCLQSVAVKAALELKAPPYELDALEPHMSKVRPKYWNCAVGCMYSALTVLCLSEEFRSQTLICGASWISMAYKASTNVRSQS